MYESLKKITTRFIPKTILKKNETFFRKLISTFYRGTNHQCNICKIKSIRFVDSQNKDLLCPKCGSRSRTRRLDKILTETKALEGTVLHFSPPKALYDKYKSAKTFTYFSSDFVNQFAADYNFDITSIVTEDDVFDVIFCYNILEHIEDDAKAIRELYRVLKPSGVCYIQTPYREGETYENYSIKEQKKRKIAFGQEDHVRIYSVTGLQQRLQNAGFKAEK